jgi:DNA adenine methylase
MRKSPLRYAGGKTRAIPQILLHLPNIPSKKIVSPFFGGGSLEIALAEKGYEVIGYDIFPILVNFWNQLLTKPNELADELGRLVPNKEHYHRNRHILLSYWNKVKPATLTYETKNLIDLTAEEKTRLDTNELLQAAYYYYNSQLSYGPAFLGWPSSVYLDKEKYDGIINNIRTFHSNIKVGLQDFQQTIANHPDDFLFLDPPYYLEGNSKMFKGIYPNGNFAIHHNGFPHETLRDLLKNHKGGFFMTYNDCSTIREWYNGYTQVFPHWAYTYGQGEKRIGKNRPDKKTTKESHEIFIISPPPKHSALQQPTS